MALNASYHTGAQYYPADMMQRDADWFSPGVISSSDLIVSQSGTPGMSVVVSGAPQGVAGGNAWLPSGYRVYNDANATLTISTADASNPRIDLIIAAVDTSTTPNFTPGLVVIKGTPSATPTAPAVPSKYTHIILAQVYVGASVTQIQNANITDMRVLSTLMLRTDPVNNLDASTKQYVDNKPGASITSPLLWISY